MDVAVVGGGVAGLWILDRLRREGLSALLVSPPGGTSGRGQTLASQGILHRGAKYLLRPGPGASFPDLLERWRACLGGVGGPLDPDLRRAGLLNEGVELRGTVPAEMAARLEAARGRGLVRSAEAGYVLAEPVIDPGSLLSALAEPHEASRVAARAAASLGPRGLRLELEGGGEIRPSRLVLAAGSGNEALLRGLGRDRPAMVRRPLHMIWVEGADLPPAWRHVLDPEAAPGRPGAHFTVTSHPDAGGWSWYVGGDPSELGIERGEAAQTRLVRRLLERAFPEVELRRARFRSERAERAEPLPADGARRLEPFVHREGPVLTVWPMKLTLAPLAADLAVRQLAKS